MERDIERIAELYASFQKRDLETILELSSPEITIVQSTELPWGGEYHGHEGLKKFLAALAQHLDTRVEIERLIDAGDHVVAVGRTVGKARATQLEYDVPIVHVWTVEAGLITRFEAYIDNATMLAALGQ
jgi:ketosteroid isomerase-like protein